MEKGAVCFKVEENVLPGQDKWTLKLVVPNKLDRLVVKENEDILNNLDADELMDADFTKLFLPVLASLTTAFDDEKLMEWIGGECDHEMRMWLDSARQKVHEYKVAVVKCEAALAFLKEKHVHVVDIRPDRMLTQPLLPCDRTYRK